MVASRLYLTGETDQILRWVARLQAATAIDETGTTWARRPSGDIGLWRRQRSRRDDPACQKWPIEPLSTVRCCSWEVDIDSDKMGPGRCRIDRSYAWLRQTRQGNDVGMLRGLSIGLGECVWVLVDGGGCYRVSFHVARKQEELGRRGKPEVKQANGW